MPDFPKYTAAYQEQVLGHMAPFWLKHARDEPYGGYFDVLTAEGTTVDAHKNVARQAEQVRAFAYLYNEVDALPKWLGHAIHGGAFLYKFAHQDDTRCYGVLDRRGRPVAPTEGVTTDCAVVQAYVQLHRATQDDQWAMLAKQAFRQTLNRYVAERQQTEQATGHYVALRHLSQPVSVLTTLLTVQSLFGAADWKDAVEDVAHDILHNFVDKRQDVLREHVLPGGAFCNTPEGRRLSMYWTLRATDALLELSHLTGHRKLALQALLWSLRLLEQAWDERAGGLRPWADHKGQPLPWVEHQHRRAINHVTALATLSKGYFYTHHPDVPRWLTLLHDYTLRHFPDANHRAWHVALDAAHRPVSLFKATAQASGCALMVPLHQAWQCMTECAKIQIITSRTSLPVAQQPSARPRSAT